MFVFRIFRIFRIFPYFPVFFRITLDYLNYIFFFCSCTMYQIMFLKQTYFYPIITHKYLGKVFCHEVGLKYFKSCFSECNCIKREQITSTLEFCVTKLQTIFENEPKTFYIYDFPLCWSLILKTPFGTQCFANGG